MRGFSKEFMQCQRAYDNMTPPDLPDESESDEQPEYIDYDEDDE